MINLRSEQCPVALNFLLGKFKELSPKRYMEIGCAQLGTLNAFHKLLPKDGLAIGLDIRFYDVWNDYARKFPILCESHLIKGTSYKQESIQRVSGLLGSNKLDFLFIDGDHNIGPTASDWNVFSPFVRSGGIVAFHDYDFQAYLRGDRQGQGAAWVCEDLRRRGYQVSIVPRSTVGTAWVRMK
jgi:predicted O-methyltransferase YrrM